MLWNIALWHSLVKMCLHSQSTVVLLDGATSEVGRSVRRFCRHTDHIETYELPQEGAARVRQKRKKQKIDDQDQDKTETKSAPKQLKLNLTTYKWHSIGHYPADVPYVGTLDLHSMHTVCSQMFLSEVPL